MSIEDEQQVKRRRVFYIPGYDPFHPRRYRELYRTESALQGEISDYQTELTPSSNKESFGWNVFMDIDEMKVSADFEVLTWSDIVRDSMPQSVKATYWQMLRTSWTYISSGTLRRLMWLRKGPVIAALYPIGMLLLQLLVAVVMAIGLGWVAVFGLTWLFKGLAYLLTFLGFGAGTDLSEYFIFAFVMHAGKWAVQIMAVVYLLRWFKSKDGRFYAHYLMHDYAFSAQLNGANPPELEARMAQFGETIAAALSEARDAIEEVIEPFLLQQGLIQRTPRGRMLAEKAWRHLGLPTPKPPGGQGALFD